MVIRDYRFVPALETIGCGCSDRIFDLACVTKFLAPKNTHVRIRPSQRMASFEYSYAQQSSSTLAYTVGLAFKELAVALKAALCHYVASYAATTQSIGNRWTALGFEYHDANETLTQVYDELCDILYHVQRLTREHKKLDLYEHTQLQALFHDMQETVSYPNKNFLHTMNVYLYRIQRILSTL